MCGWVFIYIHIDFIIYLFSNSNIVATATTNIVAVFSVLHLLFYWWIHTMSVYIKFCLVYIYCHFYRWWLSFKRLFSIFSPFHLASFGTPFLRLVRVFCLQFRNWEEFFNLLLLESSIWTAVECQQKRAAAAATVAARVTYTRIY